MWGAAPHPARVGIYMRGFTPRPNHEEIYMDIYGASPMPQSRRWYGHRPYPDRGGINPTSRSYFGKKNPKDPKKPNCIGFRLSSIDSEQGCRRQPCFLFGADSTAPAPTPRRPTLAPFPHALRPSSYRSPAAHPVARLVRPHSPHTSPAPAVTSAPAAHRHPSAPAPVPAPRKKSARLLAEVLKLLVFGFLQSISNFMVSLPNVSEKDVKGLLFRK